MLSPDVLGAIDRCVEYARTHPISRATLAYHVEHPSTAVGDDHCLEVVVPIGYRCVYSHEDQPMGPCRHLSVSQDEAPAGKGPHTEAVAMLMEAFGFTAASVAGLRAAARGQPNTTRATVRCWIEDLEDGRIAVNLVEALP